MLHRLIMEACQVDTLQLRSLLFLLLGHHPPQITTLRFRPFLLLGRPLLRMPMLRDHPTCHQLHPRLALRRPSRHMCLSLGFRLQALQVYNVRWLRLEKIQILAAVEMIAKITDLRFLRPEDRHRINRFRQSHLQVLTLLHRMGIIMATMAITISVTTISKTIRVTTSSSNNNSSTMDNATTTTNITTIIISIATTTIITTTIAVATTTGDQTMTETTTTIGTTTTTTTTETTTTTTITTADSTFVEDKNDVFTVNFLILCVLCLHRCMHHFGRLREMRRDRERLVEREMHFIFTRNYLNRINNRCSREATFSWAWK
mmetsp:Transcript_14051/g.27291  ORF Transcript_14051/g.27291 Transcript_14051/m.27291 type:complete len:317 (+) Transcript_14051:1037-1987(+)